MSNLIIQLFLMVILVTASRTQHVLGYPIQRLLTRQRGPATIRSTFSDSLTELVLPEHVQTWLDIQLPEGRCVGVSMSDLPELVSMTAESLVANPHHWMLSVYHPEELAYGMTLSNVTAHSFWLGRLAMRVALQFPKYPVLKDSYGRPQLGDETICGSISHKGSCAVALISNVTLVAGVGVDLEFTSRPGKRSIARRVLTEREQKSLGSIPGLSIEEEILLRFSLKEAIYKAAHPVLCQYVSFQEVEVFPQADGTASCTWCLESGNDAALGDLKAHWRRLDTEGFFLTSASVQRLS